MSPYKLTKLINEMLTARGLKNIPPQMIYNYCSKKYIASTFENGKIVISLEEAERFAEKYVAKRLANK